MVLPLPGSPLDPEQPAVFVVAPSELGVVEDPAVRVFQQAALCFLNTLLVITRIGEA